MTSPGASDLLQAFLSGRSERTIEAYRQDLEDFRRFLGADDLGSTVKAFPGLGLGSANLTALQFRTARIDRKLRPTSVNRKLAALHSLATLARTLGLISWKLEIANLKTERYRDTRGPEIAGARDLFNIANRREGAKGVKDQAIVRVLYDLGLRPGELTALGLDDLDLKDRTIKVMGKGRTQKQVLTLPEKTAQAIKLWLEVRGIAPGPLFTNVDHARKGDGRITGRSVLGSSRPWVRK